MNKKTRIAEWNRMSKKKLYFVLLGHNDIASVAPGYVHYEYRFQGRWIKPKEFLTFVKSVCCGSILHYFVANCNGNVALRQHLKDARVQCKLCCRYLHYSLHSTWDCYANSRSIIADYFLDDFFFLTNSAQNTHTYGLWKKSAQLICQSYLSMKIFHIYRIRSPFAHSSTYILALANHSQQRKLCWVKWYCAIETCSRGLRYSHTFRDPQYFNTT